MIDIVIPVGPNPHNRQWLPQCLESVAKQNTSVDTFTVLVHDNPNTEYLDDLFRLAKEILGKRNFHIHHNVCNLGVANSFRIGTALGNSPWIMWLASDDWLEPDCIEECWKAMQFGNKQAHYYTAVNYWENGVIKETARIACLNGMLSRALYDKIAIPYESAVGFEDKFIMSILYQYMPKAMIPVRNERGLWNHRLHDAQFFRTRKTLGYEEVINNMIDAYVARWGVENGYTTC